MTAVSVCEDAHVITIVGHGIALQSRYELASGVYLEPGIPTLNEQEVASGVRSLAEYASILTMSPHATFSLDVTDGAGGQPLAAKAWNALWEFHLLSVAARAPCCSLYSVSGRERPSFAVANRNFYFRPFGPPATITRAQLDWAAERHETFNALINEASFSAAVRCYANAQYLPDFDMRIMLLWSGIEGLLGVDAELTRRIALYSALMLPGTPSEKLEHFRKVKRAYSVRSKVVHGDGPTKQALEAGFREASTILIELLARCVDLGRVPSTEELDAIAVAGDLAALRA